MRCCTTVFTQRITASVSGPTNQLECVGPRPSLPSRRVDRQATLSRSPRLAMLSTQIGVVRIPVCSLLSSPPASSSSLFHSFSSDPRWTDRRMDGHQLGRPDGRSEFLLRRRPRRPHPRTIARKGNILRAAATERMTRMPGQSSYCLIWRLQANRLGVRSTIRLVCRHDFAVKFAK